MLNWIYRILALIGVASLVAGYSHAAPGFAQTGQDWSRMLSRIKYKGMDRCAQARATKGICIEDDVQRRAFGKVYFAFDSAEVKPEVNTALDALGEALRGDLRDAVLQVIGHTDATGSEEYNQALSERRAAAVATYLNRHFGIDPKRLYPEGRGEGQLLEKGQDEMAHQLNRRVEFVRIGTDFGG